MGILSHPFRFEATGYAAVVEDDTEAAQAEGIAVLILTRKGERPLVPDFGVTDPTFRDVDVAEVNLGLADYGPDVRVTTVTTSYPDDRTERVVLSFEE